MTVGRIGASFTASRDVLADSALRRALLGFATMLVGEWALTIVLAVVAFGDGGASAVGAVAVVRMAPSAIGTPVLMTFADRYRREHALAAIAVVRGVALAVAAMVLAIGARHVYFYAVVVMAAVAMTVLRPLHAALLPLLCTTTAELAQANVVRGLLEAVATLVGPLLAGALLAGSGTTAVLAVAAALSFGSAVTMLRVHYEAPLRPVSTDRDRLSRRSVEGLQTVFDHPDLRLVFALGFAQTYTRGALNIFTVVIAFEVLTVGEPGVAALAAVAGIGGVLGSLVVSVLVGSRRLGLWLVVALVLWGAPIAVLGAVPASLVAYCALATVGLANTIIDVPLFTLPVRLVRDEALSRVFGVFESIVAVGVALGSALTPIAIAVFGLKSAMIVTGLALPITAALAWRRMAALDRLLAVRDTEIGILRETPVLRLLPVPSIEYLASRSEVRSFPAETVVFEQGDSAECFFVIAEGSAEIIGDGSVVRTAGSGDCFGEIALLRAVPRTATVRAASDLVVLEIGKDAFLDVVGGHRPTETATEGLASSRLIDFRPAMLGI